MTQRDWAEWHDAYDEPGSALSRRLRTVQGAVTGALDRQRPGPIRIVSLCAGQGRDVIGVLRSHPRRLDVTAHLVELDPRNIAAAVASARAAALDGVRAIVGDASLTDSYSGAVPADIVLVCGVFGNITDTDIETTIGFLPQFCRADATVVWTRNRVPPDITPDVCRWFEKHGFSTEWLSPPEETGFGVGVHHFDGDPEPLTRGARMFTFIGYDALRKGAPWPS
jgi:hypothetical protein